MTSRSILDLPGIRQLHARSLLFPAVVVLAVVAVLLHGALAPPVQESAEAATDPVPAAPPVFRPEFEKTPLTYTADYWLQVGEHWRPHIILVGRDHAPAVVVTPRLAVSSAAAAEEWTAEELARQVAANEEPVAQETSESAEEGDADESIGEPVETRAEKGPQPEQPYRLISVNSEFGIAVFELAERALPAPVANLSELQSGAHAAAFSLTPDDSLRITPGVVVSAQIATDYPDQGSFVGETLDVAISFPSETRVAAIADLDGGLLGVAFEGKDGLRVVPAHKVRDIAREAGETPPCISIETQDLDVQARMLLGVTEGVFVGRVEKEAFFPEPSIRAGDIILRWAGQTVPTREAFDAAYLGQEPGSLARYIVVREGRRFSGATRVPDATCRPVLLSIVPFAKLGLILKWEEAPLDSEQPGWRVLDVLEASLAATGGVKRGDLIVGLQGRSIDPDDPRESLEELDQDPRPAVVTVAREGRLQLLAVSPEPPSPSPQTEE